MKLMRITYLLLVVVMLLSSCMKDMPNSLNGYTVSKGAKSAPDDKVLKASVESLSFSSYAGNQSFGITSNVSWQVACDADWVTVTSTTQGMGNGTVTVSVKENGGIESRTATVIVSSSDAGSVQVRITQAGENSNLQLNKNDMSFVAAGGNDSFTITSNTSWTVTSDQSWCTVSSSSGSGNSTITVNVQENTSTDSRSATITVKAGDLSQSISVTQAGANATLQLSKSSMSFNASGGNDSFTITSNTSWTITSDQSWCTLSNSSGSGNSTITVNVQENTSTDSRSSTITVKAGNLSWTISVTQVGAAPSSQSTRTFTVNGVSFKMIRVEGGTFTMGATPEQKSFSSNEKPTHRVTLSTYYIGETEVTQELWQAVMGSNPSNYSGLQKPVECVSWNDCQNFVTKLSSLTGENFSLPTEAEWEFAARGGNNSRGIKYAGSNSLDDIAWYGDNSNKQTHNVAQKSPNELGLYDMSGNVYEWCQDWYGEYSSSSQTNPTGPTSGSNRVSRGGSWNSGEFGCRVSCRTVTSPGNLYTDLGLRLAL